MFPSTGIIVVPTTEWEAAGLEPADGSRRLRASNALPYQLGHASASGRRGSRTPKAWRAHPFSRRDTAPVAVLPSSPGRRRTCTFPGKSRELCRLSYGASGVTRRDRTCGAPLFRRALYRLSYGHEHGRSRNRTGGLLLIREALFLLSYPPSSGQGWSRTSGLVFVRHALLPSELLAHEFRDKESNLDLHVQSVVSCRLDDPGSLDGSPLRPSPRRGDRPRGASVTVTALPCGPLCPSHSPTLRPWIGDRQLRTSGRPSSYVEEFWSPPLVRGLENLRLKHTRI
jgi:hypothetical protein